MLRKFSSLHRLVRVGIVLVMWAVVLLLTIAYPYHMVIVMLLFALLGTILISSIKVVQALEAMDDE